MITWNDTKNKIIIGYHDISKKKAISDTKKFLLESNPDQIPFLLTRDTYFEFQPVNLINLIENKIKEKYFRVIKNRIANILIIPGLLISLGYTLKYIGLLSQIVFLETFLDSPLINTFFWIAFLGVIILWHDYYNRKSPFTRLPHLQVMQDSELEELEHNGIQFQRYSHLNPYRYISIEYFEIFYIENKNIFVFDVLKNLLELPEISELLKRADIKLEQSKLESLGLTKQKLPNYPRVSINNFILYSLEEALITNSNDIGPIHLFLSLVKTVPELNKLVQKNGSSLNILREITKYIIDSEYRHNPYGSLNPFSQYYRTGGIAKTWIYGYTYILDQFSRDLNEEFAKESDVFGIGHEKEVENLVAILGRPNKKHALLIGEAGVGKSSLIKGLAQRINKGNVPPLLSNARIVQLDINGLIAHSTGKKNIEFVIQKAMNELAKAGNVILFIDDLQELIPAKAQETGHTIADILLPYVSEGKFAIVGTVNFSDYKKYFYTNESFRQSFTNIEVSESSAQDTLKILESKVEILEKSFDIFISFPSLVSSVELAQRYVNNRMLPDSAVNLLEDACSWAKSNGIKQLNAEHVAKIISLQTNISVGNISTQEAEQLISLEERIKHRVIGQDEAVHTISEALRRARADVRDPKRPIGAFLFIGPTGVGKTYLAKVVSKEYFNNDEDIVKVDMSEYMNDDSVSKLLGSESQSKSGQVQNTLLDKVKANPYTVVLFDEIEKASSKILDLFLQLFEEGRLTSTSGEVIDFTNTIIICTSNIAANIVLESLETHQLWDETKSRVIIELKQAIRPELFNRFDDIVIFHPQDVDQLAKISDMLLDELYKRLHEKNIELDWDPTIPMLIANKAYEPGFGARPIRRYIQEKVEGQIAQEMINGNIKTGDTVMVKESWIS